MLLRQTKANEITVEGNIKTIDDYMTLKKAVTAIVEAGNNQVLLTMCDSISMPSSVLGFFVKLVNHDKIRVSMNVADRCLFELLEELGMIELFHVRLTSRKGCGPA